MAGYECQVEKSLKDSLLSADFYLPQLDMVIDMHGPVHFRNNGRADVLVDSSLYIDRIYKRYFKHYVVITYKDVEVLKNSDKDIEKTTQIIKKKIEDELNRK